MYTVSHITNLIGGLQKMGSSGWPPLNVPAPPPLAGIWPLLRMVGLHYLKKLPEKLHFQCTEAYKNMKEMAGLVQNYNFRIDHGQ